MTSEKKPGLKEKRPSLVILVYLFIKEKRGNIVHSGGIEVFGQTKNYKAETAARRARDLATPKHRSYNPMIERLDPQGSTAYATGPRMSSLKVPGNLPLLPPRLFKRRSYLP